MTSLTRIAYGSRVRRHGRSRPFAANQSSRRSVAVAGMVEFVVELQRLDHVSLNVSDRSRSIAWYRDVLGLAQRGEPRRDDWPVFMGEFGACVALFQAQVEAPERQPESTGLRHVAFMVGPDELGGRKHAWASMASSSASRIMETRARCTSRIPIATRSS